jgi:signal transduction histidine kinase
MNGSFFLRPPAKRAGHAGELRDAEATAALEASRKKLRNLYRYLRAAREKERTRLAKYVHDELSQTLIALKIDLDRLGKSIPGRFEEEHERIRAASSLTGELIRKAQFLHTELRPSILDDLGLRAACEWQVAEFGRKTGIRSSLISNVREARFDPEVSTALFRILQESLLNAARHSGATRVVVRLTHNRDERFELRVTDNGRGIRRKELTSPTSYGLIGIREQAKALKGWDSIRGFPGKGTMITVSLPSRGAGDYGGSA